MLTRITAAILLVLLASALAAGQDRSADDKETIRVDTRLVSVPVIVSDKNGRYTPGLTQSDFAVFQDGEQQKIEFFAATEEPLTIALLIDTSLSTRPVLSDIKDSAKSFITLLRPNDRAMIVSFDFETLVLGGLSSDHEKLKKAINAAEIPRTAGTLMRDAVYQTINNTFAGITGRKAIILLTDGKDAGSWTTTRQLLYSLQESDTLVYPVMFKTGDRPNYTFGGRNGPIFGGGWPGGFPPLPRRQDPRRAERQKIQNDRAEEMLREISDSTAGRYFSSKNGKLKETFNSILEELRFQYRIGFYPPEEMSVGSLHELKVRVNRNDVAVRARTGYRVQ